MTKTTKVKVLGIGPNETMTDWIAFKYVVLGQQFKLRNDDAIYRRVSSKHIGHGDYINAYRQHRDSHHSWTFVGQETMIRPIDTPDIKIWREQKLAAFHIAE